MKQRYNEYPLYNLCCKYTDGKERVIKEKVGIKEGCIDLKKFDRLFSANKEAVKDVLYCYLIPLRDLKPRIDMDTGDYIY